MAPDVFALTGARLSFGARVLWDQLDLTVSAGEFVAVLGPNGSGKTSLLRVLLGELTLSAGTATLGGEHVPVGSSHVGYVPQHRAIDQGLTMRGRDLVGLGVDGHRWGFTSLRRTDRARRHGTVERALSQVDGTHLADRPVGMMSGGEVQRLRIAQAIASDPVLLLCDEPLLNLDPASAQRVSALIDQRRREAATAVVFVTHDVNPVLPYVDRVLYLVDGRFRIGSVAEVMTSANLSELYRADVEVLQVGERYVVIGENLDQSGHTVGHTHE